MPNETKQLTGYPSIDKPWLKYYSEEAINAPIPNKSIYQWIIDNNKDTLDNIAVNYLGYKITYKELFNTIDQVSAAFIDIGVKEGDIITLAIPNIPENVISIYALNKIGAIANLIDLRHQGEDLVKYYNEVGSTVAIVSDIFFDNTWAVLDKTSLEQLIVVSPYDHLPFPVKQLMKRKYKVQKTGKVSIIPWKKFVKKRPDIDTGSISVKSDDVACILHTSGTTGDSKGVMLSNHCFNAMTVQVMGYANYQQGDRFLNQVPPFLAYNTVFAMHLPLSLQLEMIMLPDYNPEKFAKNILRNKINFAVAGPADMSNFLEKDVIKKDTDLSFIKTLASGSDSISPEKKQQINTVLEKHGCKNHVMEGYGMTEVGSAAATCLPECDVLGSVGIPYPKMNFCIWDNENNEELAYNAKGEICISGPTLMNGYYNKVEETKAALKDHGEGIKWMHTGDLGYLNEEGCIFLDGRLKRIIIQYNGMKINPYEIEKTLLEDENVAECCVVGSPDLANGSGSVAVAFIVPRDNSKDDNSQIEMSLRSLCDENLVERYRPAQYYFKDNLPLTPNGKIDYRSLEAEAKTILK